MKAPAIAGLLVLLTLSGCSQREAGEPAWGCARVDVGPGTYLQGHVTQDGKPAVGAAVQAKSGNVSRDTSTGDDGCFMLRLEPGDWDVMVSKGGKSTDATLRLGNDEVRQYAFLLP